jgi:hypothetical protein
MDLAVSPLVCVDVSTDGGFVCVAARLVLGGVSHRFGELKNIAARTKLGTRYVRVPQKNRHTLRQTGRLGSHL